MGEGMNCDDTVYSREEVLQFAKREAERKEIETLNWVLKLLGTGMTDGMVRYQIEKKLADK